MQCSASHWPASQATMLQVTFSHLVDFLLLRRAPLFGHPKPKICRAGYCQELDKIREALITIFTHLKKIGTSQYPIESGLRLVDAISHIKR